jgi:hypothetical protein
MSIAVHLVTEGHITLPPAVLVGQVVTERNVSPLFTGEMGNDHCDSLFPVEE